MSHLILISTTINQTSFVTAFKLSRKFRVNTLHLYGVISPPPRPPFNFSCFFLRTLDDPVLNVEQVTCC